MYSQNNEEEIIIRYFNGLVGTFLEIGSNDGITLSNTHALALNGWKGICIEPSPKSFHKLCGTYFLNDDIFCYKLAVSDHNGSEIFYESGEHLGKGDNALLSTLNKEELKRWEGTNNKFTETKVDVLDFKTFLNISQLKQFEIISIDAEGQDLRILKQMDLKELNCKCICIEYNSQKEVLSEILSYCSQFGLNKVLLTNAENVILCV